ncbi:hypothetical protein LIER_20174 [Lithospermum erythrorhizon]|uniref:DUF4283 domain-containing protein n=1 Tax=Lithospermum erythrorhizon TaxID=34254 RepID=A0AAV3QN31_LITER
MKKKKKRKNPSPEPDNDVAHLVASNADPTLLVRVPHDSRVNVDGVLDKQLQLEVEQWSQSDLPIPANTSSGVPAGSSNLMAAPQSNLAVTSSPKLITVPHETNGEKTQAESKNPSACPVSRSDVEDDSIRRSSIAPQSANPMQNAFHAGCPADMTTETGDALKCKNPGKTKSALSPCDGSGTSSGGSQKAPLAGLSLVFKAGSSGLGSEAMKTGSSVRGPKSAGPVLQLARKAKPRDSGVSFGAGIAPMRSNLPTALPTGPEAAIPRTVPADFSPENSKVRPKFSEIIKENRIVGNGLKLQQYDFMENDDDVILDESDEIPFVETWDYCLIGCFTGPFPGRHALNSLVKSWNVKCKIIPYAKGWTVFRFASDEDRFKVFNGGPYLAFGKTLMLKLVDAGVILGDDLFTSVPTWVLFHDVPLFVWSESGLSKIASKVGIPMYTDKVTKDRTKMSYARCLIDVDVSKPPVMEFGVKLSGGRRYIQKVTYECYPDYCCECKTFGHNVFKCKKNSNEVVTPVVETTIVLLQVIPSKAPASSSTSTNNHDKPIPPRATRAKIRAKPRNDPPLKDSSPKDATPSSVVSERDAMVGSSSKNGKGLKNSVKDKEVTPLNQVVSPNSFDVLKNIGGSNGNQDGGIVDVQMGDLVPPSTEHACHGVEEGVWQHVSRKGHPNGRGGALSSSVPPCG